MTTRDPNLISLGRRPRPTGRAVPLTPATRAEIERFEDSLRIAAGFRVVCPPVLWLGVRAGLLEDEAPSEARREVQR